MAEQITYRQVVRPRAQPFRRFRHRCSAELREAAEHLCDLAEHDKLILLTATKDVDRSQAAVLADRPAKGHPDCPKESDEG
jgi:uncharacterized protein YeaO (DUF488 family)